MEIIGAGIIIIAVLVFLYFVLERQSKERLELVKLSKVRDVDGILKVSAQEPEREEELKEDLVDIDNMPDLGNKGVN